MRLKEDILQTDETPVLSTVMEILVEHFNYSIADIESYDELTDEEKEIIPREIFDELVE